MSQESHSPSRFQVYFIMVLSYNIKSPDKLGNYSKRYPILIFFVFGLNLILTGCAREKAVYRPGINNELEKKVLATSGQKVNAVQAEKYLKKAIELESQDPSAAAWAFRNLCLISESEFASKNDLDNLAAIHRISLRHLIHITGADKANSPDELTQKLAVIGITVRNSDPDWTGLQFTKLVPCEDYENLNIEPIVKVSGWGLPILADRVYSVDEMRSPAESFFPTDNRLTCTARLSSSLVEPVSDISWEQIPAELVLHSPFDEETIQLAGGIQTRLAADFTTPSLVQFSQSGLQALEYEGLLLPELVRSKASVYLNEPYRPGKIPVLFVHGLWSSPRTWTDMNNLLLADPEIRRNYQFFFALYPTGEPVLDSAGIIRDKIREIRDTFDPARQDPAWEQMVVVCHSMGGIVSRLLITDSGETFEQAFFTRRIEELDVTDKTRELLIKRLRFQAVPEIKRVAFIAPVFRGSSFASRPLGRISSSLIRPLNEMGEIRDEIIARNGIDVIQPAHRRIGIANGIDNLEPDNPSLIALDKTKPNPQSGYHIILGDNGKLIPKLKGMITDGLVTYQSGHLDGAESEVIFQANHFLNHEKPVIEEVQRILRHHLNVSNQPLVAGNQSDEFRK